MLLGGTLWFPYEVTFLPQARDMRLGLYLWKRFLMFLFPFSVCTDGTKLTRTSDVPQVL